MSKIVPCRWFNGEAEAAATFDVALFPAASVAAVSHDGEGMPFPAGTTMRVEFTLARVKESRGDWVNHDRKGLAIKANRDRRGPFHAGAALTLARFRPEGVPVRTGSGAITGLTAVGRLKGANRTN